MAVLASRRPMPLLEWFDDPELRRQLLASLGLVVTALLLRSFFWRLLRGTDRVTTRERLRWGVAARNGALAVIVVGLVVIWGSELQGFAVSVVALAAAFAIAAKELFMCVSGSLVRAVSRSFDVGDRIEVRGLRGDVIDTNILSTTLLEVGPGHQRTGRALTIPNSVLLTDHVVNETFTGDFVLHFIELPTTKERWLEDEERALTIAEEVCGGLADDARAEIDAVGKRSGLSPFSVSPRVMLQHPTADEVRLLLRVPTRARSKGRTQQTILRRYLGADADLSEPTDPTAF